eukprot:8818926-Alexandrium_andersonii.AAC.1
MSEVRRSARFPRRRMDFRPVAGLVLDRCVLKGRGGQVGCLRIDLAQIAMGAPVSYTHLTLPTICSV